MSTLYAAVFPRLDVPWIAEFRNQHDPLASLIAPHVTLVFPTDRLDAEHFQGAIQIAASTSTPFQAIFRSTILILEENSARIFLVPDEGFSRIVELHDRVYAGELTSSLRLDVPFIPHITLGSHLDLKTAKELVDGLNASPFEVCTAIDHIQVVAVEGSRQPRQLLDRFPLI
jgi:2'-5' RNA ligase